MVWECHERIVLEQWPDGRVEDDVTFKLVLRGGLPPNKRGTTDLKHRIRRELHPQLRMLWQQHGILRNAFKPRPKDGVVPVEELADDFAKFGFRFVPLVRQGFACSLEILLLRRDEPFRVFAGSGDLDGRVKTLFDGFRMPAQRSELNGNTPQEDEDPFFCLLEDDKHIFNVDIKTDRLLVPQEESEALRDVFAVIGVHVRYALGAEIPVVVNASLWPAYGPKK